MARPSGRRTSQFSLPQGQPQPQVPSVENNFVGGLKTEFTGLNFPENACTSTTNCRFTRTGNVLRRNGFDYEQNFAFSPVVDRTNQAISTFVWTNAGGTGNQVILVTQIGGTLYFYLVSSSTVASPMSTMRLANTVTLSKFQVTASSIIATECQYASGNGYLFVFHPGCDPFYCTFDGVSTITSNVITIQIRDFIGLNDGLSATTRPTNLTAEHQYNIQNQGWASSTSASQIIQATGTNNTAIPSIGTYVFTIAPGLGIIPATSASVTIFNPAGFAIFSASGTVISYSGTQLTLNLTFVNTPLLLAGAPCTIQVSAVLTSTLIATWFNALGFYPSNSDIWWTFKDTNDNFNPLTTVGNVTLNAGVAPKGYYLISAFNQQRSVASGVGGITPVITQARPRTGAWFQGRVWYSGVDASQTAIGDAAFYTWTENIYFSQIITNVNQFGMCYENNDPTSETLNTELPTDGGVIQIQGCGSIFKLFPVQNGLLVFAANGIWFITGSSGIGFAANDYTISKISGDHSISGTSFVDVNGWPVFWNNDGIYMVNPGQSYTSGQTALQVQNITLPTIKQFFQSIPLPSKLFARGSYNHITGEIQWVYKSTRETDVTSRYSFDSVLVFLTYTQAFYTWSVGSGSNIHSADYIEFSGSSPSTAPSPTFKYFTSTLKSPGLYNFTFSEERSTTYTDWASSTPVSYVSNFQTGYRLKGQGQRKSQPQYLWVYGEIPTSSYTLQSVWDFAASSTSGRISGVQVFQSAKPLFNKTIRRHRIRGNGYVVQFLFGSVTGQPFNLSGWAVLDTIGIQ